MVSWDLTWVLLQMPVSQTPPRASSDIRYPPLGASQCSPSQTDIGVANTHMQLYSTNPLHMSRTILHCHNQAKRSNLHNNSDAHLYTLLGLCRCIWDQILHHTKIHRAYGHAIGVVCHKVEEVGIIIVR